MPGLENVPPSWWDQPLHKLYDMTAEELYQAFRERLHNEVMEDLKKALKNIT